MSSASTMSMPSTFFVVGSAAIDNPDVVRRILADGNEIGVHTLTHADLGSAPPWRQQLEVQGDQQVIAGITGQAATLLRPPYSSENDAVRDGTWTAMRTAATGLPTALTTKDSEDWRRPGVAAIEQNLAPSGPKGRSLMHDGGGDRDRTVAALDSSSRSSRIKVSGSRRRATPSGSLAWAMPQRGNRSAEPRWMGNTAQRLLHHRHLVGARCGRNCDGGPGRRSSPWWCSQRATESGATLRAAGRSRRRVDVPAPA